MSTIDLSSILSAYYNIPSTYSPASTSSSTSASTSAKSTETEDTETVEMTDEEQQEAFATSVKESIDSGIYDIKVAQKFDYYQAEETTDSTETTDEPITEEDIPDLLKEIRSLMENSTMNVLASMSPDNSGLNVLGGVYAQYGIISNLSKTSSTFEYLA